MFYNLSLNAILVLVIGLLLLIAGAHYGINSRRYYFAAGLISLGFGTILCGLTNGFSDHTPKGRFLKKIGILALLIGLPLVFYNLYRFI